MPEDNNPISGATNNALPVNPTEGGTPKSGSDLALGAAEGAFNKALGSKGPEVGTKVDTSPEGDYKPGDKLGNGREVGEDGTVQRTSTQRLFNTVAKAGTLYATGGNGKAAKAAGDLADSRIGNTIVEQGEKSKIISGVAEGLSKNGVTDGAEGLVNGATAALNGDVKGVEEGVKEVKKGTKKLTKTVMLSALTIAAPYIIATVVFVGIAYFVITSPNISGYMTLSDRYDWSEGGGTDIEDPENPSDPNDPSSGNTGCATGAVANNPKVKALFGTDCIPNNDTEMKKYMVDIYVDINTSSGKSTKKLTVHKGVADDVKRIFAQIYSSGALVNPSKTSCYYFRSMVTNSSQLSAHSFGLACDVNSDVNPLCYKNNSCYSNPPSGKYANGGAIANAFKSNGWKWGGEWSSYKDWMHFSLTGN